MIEGYPKLRNSMRDYEEWEWQRQIREFENRYGMSPYYQKNPWLAQDQNMAYIPALTVAETTVKTVVKTTEVRTVVYTFPELDLD